MVSEYLCLPVTRVSSNLEASVRGPTLELEGEVIRQVAAFVISSQEEQGVGVPHLQ